MLKKSHLVFCGIRNSKRTMDSLINAYHSNTLPQKVHKSLNWFSFFLGYPCLYLLGNSVTLYIFIYILYLLNSKIKSLYNFDKTPKKILIYFALFALIGLFFAPWDELRVFSMRPFQLYFQFFYWITIALFLVEFYQVINWKELIKFFFIGIVAQIITYYLIKQLILDFEVVLIVIANHRSRNSLLFQMIGATPLMLAYFHILKKSWITKILLLFFILGATLISGGRAGSVIIFLLCFLFYARHILLRPVGAVVVALISFLLVANFSQYEEKLEAFSYRIEPFNERLAQMLRGKGENTDLSQDRSLLERQLHIEKGFEIVQKYPFLGLGVSNYINYDSPIAELTEGRFLRLQGSSADYYNRRSPHNSYVQVAAEMGLIGLACFLLLILYPLWILFFRNEGNIWSIAVFLSLLGISMHFYTIASAYGTITWFFIGIANAEAYRISQKRKL